MAGGLADMTCDFLAVRLAACVYVISYPTVLLLDYCWHDSAPSPPLPALSLFFESSQATARQADGQGPEQFILEEGERVGGGDHAACIAPLWSS